MCKNSINVELRWLRDNFYDSSLPQRGGVGEKFFESTTNTSVLKQMKKRLSDAADHHHKCVTEPYKRERFEVSGQM